MIKECLKAAGIKKVIWVDDHFAKPSRDDVVEQLVNTARKLKESGIAQIEALPTLDLNLSVGALEEQIESLSNDMSDEELIELSEKIWEAVTGSVDETPLNDLSTEEFRSLKAAFGKDLTAWSLQDWTSKGAESCAEFDTDTLFLVDKEFTRESSTFDGSEIVATVVTQSRAFCIFLTHRFTAGEEERSAREQVARDKKIQFHKFAVLSKRPGKPDEDIKTRFTRAFSTVMLQRFTGDLAHTIAETIKQNAEETALKLSQVSVSDINQAIFVNSAREGVQEFDAIVRVFRVLQGKALNDALRMPSLQSELRTVRNFTKSTRNLGVLEPETLALKEFKEWRRNEIFEDGAGLNAMHAPLVCGDIFQSSGDLENRYVLLGQACDLMIRREGGRRATLGFLLRLEEVESGQREAIRAKAPYRRFELGKIFSDQTICHVDFQNLLVANLDVLDLVVFNANGATAIDFAFGEPEMALTEGWSKRLKKIKKKFGLPAGPVNEIALAVGDDKVKLKSVVTSDSIKYPYKRIGRLNGHTATAVLAAWATFETRAALEHDFAASEESTVREGVAIPE